MSVGKSPEERAQQAVERLSFFSDAVFAIAMTLLIVEVRLPHGHLSSEAALGEALLNLIPNYIGFLISFLVLARFWAAHHIIMSYLKAAPPRLVWTNLFLLLAVAFMPFPTAVISEYVQLRVGVGFYAAWLVILGLLNHRLVMIASHPDIFDEGADANAMRVYRRTSWIPILIGGAAFAAGMVTPIAALFALMFGSPLIAWLIRRRD